jgi:hypothetical protein
LNGILAKDFLVEVSLGVRGWVSKGIWDKNCSDYSDTGDAHRRNSQFCFKNPGGTHGFTDEQRMWREPVHTFVAKKVKAQ